MATTPVITTTISREILAWVDAHAKTTKRTRRVVLEEALEKYKEEMRKEQLRTALLLEEADPEVHEMAEWGLVDDAALIAGYERQ